MKIKESLTFKRRHSQLKALTLSVPEFVCNPRGILKHLLEENDLTTKDLAQLLGVDHSLASRLLSGTRKITPLHAKGLGEYFGVRPGLFLGL